MSRITIVTTLRFFAAIAPAILLVVSPVLTLAIIWLGSAPAAIRDVQVAALEHAQALDTALYKMEWGRTQPDSSQIVLDQERRFADMLDSAARVAISQEQRDRIAAIASASKPTLDALRQANPRDDSLDPKMRELHTMVTELITADDTALMQASDDVRAQAHTFAIVAIASGIVVPLACYAAFWWLGGKLRRELHLMRQALERFSEHRPATEPEADIVAIDLSLTNLGFPKPNPMLADE